MEAPRELLKKERRDACKILENLAASLGSIRSQAIFKRVALLGGVEKTLTVVFHSEGSYHIHMHRYCAGASKYHSLPGNEQLYAVFVSYSGLLRLGTICFGQQKSTLSLHMKVTQF